MHRRAALTVGDGAKRGRERRGTGWGEAALTEGWQRWPVARRKRRRGSVDGEEEVPGLAEVGEDVTGVRTDGRKIVGAADGVEVV